MAMAGYDGRRSTPSFSQYLTDLNTIPSPYDMALQQQAAQQQQQSAGQTTEQTAEQPAEQHDSFSIDADLQLFTNTEFFDFDHFGDLTLPTFDAVGGVDGDKTGAAPGGKYLDLLSDGVDTLSTPYPSDADLQLGVSPIYPSLAVSSSSTTTTTTTTTTTNSSSNSSNSRPLSTSASPAKRKTAKATTALSVEEAARIAAEEDKRRRNTAASARFRVKKKLREQALEHTVKETMEKNAALEARVSQLELENRWLKNLITEKNDAPSSSSSSSSALASLDGKRSERDIADMFQKFLASKADDSPAKPVRLE